MKKLLSLAMAVMMLMVFAACGGGSTATTAPTEAPADPGAATEAPAASGGTLKIGGIGPVTGGASIYGVATKNGAQIAVDEINAAGGIDGIMLELNWQDDEHDPEKAVNAYNQLKDWGMQLLVGTTTSTPSVAVSSEANADRIFMLTPSASSTDVIGGQPDASGVVTYPRKDNVYQMCFNDPIQGEISAKMIAEKGLGTKIAVIYNNSDAYSTGIYNTFVATAEELKLEIVSTTTFTDDTATDFSVQLQSAQSAGADLVYLPIYYTPVSLILSQAKGMGYAPKFFGVDGMDGILTLEGFDTSLAEGVMLLTPFSSADEGSADFVQKYESLYSDTPNQFAADAYDCVYTIADAVKRAGITADMDAASICDKLIAVFNDASFVVNGLTGTDMTWADGTGMISKEPRCMVIQNGVYVIM